MWEWLSNAGAGSNWAGGADAGSQAEWDMFDNAAFDDVSNEGIASGSFGMNFDNADGVMAGMMGSQQPQQGGGGQGGGMPSLMGQMNAMRQMNQQPADPFVQMPQNPYLLDLLKRAY